MIGNSYGYRIDKKERMLYNFNKKCICAMECEVSFIQIKLLLCRTYLGNQIRYTLDIGNLSNSIFRTYYKIASNLKLKHIFAPS